MRLALCILAGTTWATPSQDEWRPLALTRLDLPADSAVVAGVQLAPSPGTIDIVIGVDKACQGKVGATYQARGAVVKIRLDAPPVSRQCPALDRPQAYRAQVVGLKAKRHQVVVYTLSQKRKWLPWKAAVTDVP
jgi:hypothetical protein